MATSVTLTLAHPLTADYTSYLGLEDRDYDIGEEITVKDRATARALINNGRVTVNPADKDAIRAALGLPARNGPARKTAPSRRVPPPAPDAA